MKKEDFVKAVMICSKYHTTEIMINKPKNNFVGDLGNNKFTIHITKCVPAVVTDLIEAGYHLSMNEDGLYVDKF